MILDPISTPLLGDLKNRVVMSAMTRGFAGPGHVATPAIRDYYARRAAGGVALILTEGVIVDPTADGYNDVPHIATIAQGKKLIPTIEAVHAEGSKIVCQLWHCGRISHSDYTGGVPPVSSTNRAAEGINRQNGKPFGTPRALRADEMPEIYAQYVRATRLALDVGFDAVQLHLGHGYLADQFFDARVNDRTDEYGGSVEGRCRFGLEALRTVIDAFGHEKIIVRMSPAREMNGPYDWPDLDAMLAYLVPALDAAGLRMLDVSCARADYYATSGRIIRAIRSAWPHLMIGGASLTLEQANEEVSAGLVDLVTWGRDILANPDFVSRLRTGEALRPFGPELLKTLE